MNKRTQFLEKFVKPSDEFDIHRKKISFAPGMKI